MTYQAKPIRAIQFTGNNQNAVVEFTDGLATDCEVFAVDAMKIPTPSGPLVAGRGDWIIRDIGDVYWLCKPDVFEATFEPVTATCSTCKRRREWAKQALNATGTVAPRTPVAIVDNCY